MTDARKTCRNCRHLQENLECHQYRQQKSERPTIVQWNEEEIDDFIPDMMVCYGWDAKDGLGEHGTKTSEQPIESETETSLEEGMLDCIDAHPIVDEVEEMRLELESLRQFNEEVKRRNQEINNFKPKKPLNATDHPLLFSGKKESEHSVNIDDWKNWPAKDHFDFTEKEWELMAPAEGVTEITVGYLSDFCVRLGREKIEKLDIHLRERKFCPGAAASLLAVTIFLHMLDEEAKFKLI